jgi:hypothetical protein
MLLHSHAIQRPQADLGMDSRAFVPHHDHADVGFQCQAVNTEQGIESWQHMLVACIQVHSSCACEVAL